MIGPPTPSGNEGQKSESSDANRKSLNSKRKSLDDLDMEDFCEQLCHGEKSSATRFAGIQEMIGSTVEEDFLDPAQGDLGDSSLTRLEVLVVDGVWDENDAGGGVHFEEVHLTELGNYEHVVEHVEHHQEVPLVEADFGDVPMFWQTTTTCSSPAPGGTAPEPPRFGEISVVKAPRVSREEENLDQELDGNLSWLLDFKLDALIEVPSDDNSSLPPTKGVKGKNGKNSAAMYINEVRKSQNYSNARLSSYGKSDDPSCQKKPPFTYTELIEHALQENGQLTVSAIYQWISWTKSRVEVSERAARGWKRFLPCGVRRKCRAKVQQQQQHAVPGIRWHDGGCRRPWHGQHFPYYKSNDDRWKNSVRHNLSINPHFRKGSKAPHGAGHLWTIANTDENKSRSIFANSNFSSTTKQILKNISLGKTGRTAQNNQIVTMDEVEAATASICVPPEEEEEQAVEAEAAVEENRLREDIDDMASETEMTASLERSAEQILNGIKKNVQVQYLVPMINSENAKTRHENDLTGRCSLKETDFLNPVSKETVVEECGLIGEGYLVTDLSPTVLGLNMTESEIVSPENLFGEELSFQFYELQSA